MSRFSSYPAFSHKQLYLLFVLILACVGIADSMMGYVTPIYIEELTGSATRTGIILASSSLAGIVCDFLFAKLFPKKHSSFFLLLLFSLVFFFPLAFFLHQHVITSIIGMVTWGIYFEAMVFANFHAIHESVQERDHAWAWGTASILRNLAWAIGPIGASVFYEMHPSTPLRAAILIYALAMLIAFVYEYLRTRTPARVYTPTPVIRRTLREELLIWKTYGRTLWPLLLLNTIFFCIESAFFSIGPLLGEQLKEVHTLGGIFVATYSIPGIVMGFLVATLSRPYGKKRLAYLGGVLAGLGLIAVGIVPLGVQVLVFALLGSIGLCLLSPALSAVFEDFVARSGEFGNDLVGLTAMTASFSYIVGPIVNGMLSDRFGNQAVFGIWGVIISGYSLILFFIVKRKVALPVSQVVTVLQLHHLKQL